VLFGPTDSPYGTTNLFGALRAGDGEDRLLRPQGFQRVGLNLRT
jgi:IMP dehydrogenase